jgi:hypothetical protein
VFNYTFFTCILHSHHIRLPIGIHLESRLIGTFSKKHQYSFHTILFICINNLIFLYWPKLEDFITKVGPESLIRIDHLQELIFYYFNIFFIFEIYFYFLILVFIVITITILTAVWCLIIVIVLLLLWIGIFLFFFDNIFYSLYTSFFVSLNDH